MVVVIDNVRKTITWDFQHFSIKVEGQSTLALSHILSENNDAIHWIVANIDPDYKNVISRILAASKSLRKRAGHDLR